VPESLLGLLKLCLLALLYLFFARVLWAVWTEVRAVRPQTDTAGAPAGAAGTGREQRRARRGVPGLPHRLTVTEPPHLRGNRFELTGVEMTIGRAAGCQVSLPDDTFASTVHARVYGRDGAIYVEDLGSTNGTYLDRSRVTAPTPVPIGVPIRIGRTVMELRP
jgi:pSer/pThr/pTyr-binding forkhead associated (FHA) protein